MNKLDYSRMKDAAAIQFMVLDMLGNIMTLSETPAKMGIYLTQQIRQLVGARIVMLIQYTGWESIPDFRVISIEPERHRGNAKLSRLNDLLPLLRDLQEGVIWSLGNVPDEASTGFQAIGCESLIAIPLSMASEPVGALLALDLLEMDRSEDVLRSLEILGPFVGMVIRNAFYYENLESEVQIRTKELADSEKHLRNLTEVAPVGIFHLDHEGRLVFVNEQWRQITGLEWSEGSPEAFQRLIHPEDRENAGRLWQEALADQKEFHGEYRLLRTNGSIVWVIGKAVFEFNEEGRLSAVIGTLTDITKRKQAEETTRESEARFRRAIEEAPMPVMIHAEDGEVITISRTWTEISGYRHEDIPTTSEWTKRAYGIDQPKILELVSTLYLNPQLKIRGEYEVTCLDGSKRTWDFSSISLGTLPDGRRIAMSTASDITERKETEESLRESNYRLNLATDSAQMAVWDWNLLTGTMIWDDRMFQLYGATREEIHGTVQDWKDGLHPEDHERAVKECEAAILGLAPFNTEFKVVHRDGTVLWVKADATVLRDAGGKPQRMIGLNRDVTASHLAEVEKTKLQSQLQQVQKMESLGSLAGGVAHDMNNVLGAILGMASANLDLQPVNSPAYRAFDTIIQAASRGGKMVKSLLSFSRQSPVEERPLNMNSILREEVALLERTTLANIRLEMDLDPALQSILGDASALTHAVMNLCVNAVDAMPEKGTITLRSRNIDGDWIEVIVEDTGTGMSKEIQEKAMDPFFTTKEVGKGTGLGLSMVYSTVKAHRGQLEILSNPGQGTRVLLRFPTCRVPGHLPDEVGGPPHEATIRALKVLVVDDDELIQSSAMAILEVLGHDAVGATSGEEALARLENGFQPDVVILDLNMPGLGGAGTLQQLRALNPTVPVLIATGRVDEFATDLVGSYSYVALLPKPYSLGELRAQLEPYCQFGSGTNV